MNDVIPVNELFSSIQGEGNLAGRRQVFIRLAGCNLECGYCDTDVSESSVFKMEITPGAAIFNHRPRKPSASEITDIIMAWNLTLPGAHHSISLTGGEPLLHTGLLAGWLPQLRALLPLHLETNGTLPGNLAPVVGYFDYISMDIKLPSTSGYDKGHWAAHRQFLKVAVETDVSVKIVVGDTTDDEEIDTVCEMIASIKPDTPLFIQPRSYPGGKCGIGSVHLLRLQARAAARLPDVRVIPQMHLFMGVL